MRWPVVCLAALAAGCQAPSAPSFDINALTADAETEQVELKGWLQIDADFRFYPRRDDLGQRGKGSCLTGRMLSLAGPMRPEFNNKEMVISGYIARMGTPDVGGTADDCGSGKILMAMNLAYP